MKQAAENLCQEIRDGQPPRWLSLLGPAGVGKTHLARQIYAFFNIHMEGRLVPGQDPTKTAWRMRGRFASWRNVAEQMRNGDFSFQRDLESSHFCAIDDIGAEYRGKSDFIAAKLDAIIDRRLGKWTVITSNLSLEQINDQLDARIASRMKRGGSEVVDVETMDFNMREKP